MIAGNEKFINVTLAIMMHINIIQMIQTTKSKVTVIGLLKFCNDTDNIVHLNKREFRENQD